MPKTVIQGKFDTIKILKINKKKEKESLERLESKNWKTIPKRWEH